MQITSQMLKNAGIIHTPYLPIHYPSSGDDRFMNSI
jgi:hypothetical protein